MNKIILSFCLLFSLSLYAQTMEGPKNGPVISFKELSHEFGDIVQGDSVSYTYSFKNTGTAPLIISEVVTTCGCTVPSFSKEPIAPGGSGDITVVFKSAGKEGRQNKIITVLSNATNNPARLSMILNVLPPKR